MITLVDINHNSKSTLQGFFFFLISGFPGVSSSTGFFSGFVFTMCSFSPPHPTKGEFRIQFLPRPLNECASSVTERGNGMVTFAYWLNIFKERLPLARQGSSAGYTAEKKTELSAVTGLIFWGGDRCFTQK